MPAQNYYWYEGKKMTITLSEQQRAVKFAEQTGAANRVKITAALRDLSSDANTTDLGNGIILFNVNTSAQPAALQALQAQNGVAEIPVFKSVGLDETLIGNNELIVKFKINIQLNDAQKIIQQYGAKIKEQYKWESNTFIADVLSGKNVVDVANDIFEKERDRVDYAQPNFLRLFKPFFVPNDSLFKNQWALQNTGQTGGITGQDIQCVPAWDKTRGSVDIIIAVIDEGVDYTHEDLNVQLKLVTGYNALTRTDDCNPENNDAHGTACAGIAAGGGNNILGISGVAPSCRIMGVKIARGVSGRWVTSDLYIADGINTAVTRGADVLSNSWGGGSPSSVITNAIRNAKINGRNGKGCIVCFAAGNNNGPVSYPGFLSEVITVAACNEYGERKSPTSRDGEKWGSNFGAEVDVCAPGVHIFTTDISGSSGYSGNNYTDKFNGTSAATPHVAGVAALVLSINRQFTAVQVEDILRSSTDDLGSAGYNIYTGYGRINALKAIDNALRPPVFPTKQYKIMAKHSGLCLNVAYASMTSGPVIQWPWSGGQGDELWGFESVGDGYYKIVAKHSGLCLDIQGGYQWPGAPLHQHPYWGGDNQKFRLELVNNNFYKIVAKHSGLCLNVAGGSLEGLAPVIQWPFEGSRGNDLWQFIDVPFSATGDDIQPGEVLNHGKAIVSSNGRYQLVYQGDGKLALYDGNRQLWATNTWGKSVGVCIMQRDGNFVMYNADGLAIWSSNTRTPESKLVLQSDGNMVIYSPDGKPLWSTGTWQG